MPSVHSQLKSFAFFKLFMRRKKILFDGDQAELFSKNYPIKCSCCDQCSYISPLECNAASNLPSEVLTNVLSAIKGLKVLDLAGSKIYKVDHLPLKYIYFDCKIFPLNI